MMELSVMDWVLFVIALAAGYYAVSHYLATQRPY
jgi:hypothetical protein